MFVSFNAGLSMSEGGKEHPHVESGLTWSVAGWSLNIFELKASSALALYISVIF